MNAPGPQNTWSLIRFEAKRLIVRDGEHGPVSHMLLASQTDAQGEHAGRGRVRYYRYGGKEAVVRRCLRGGLVRVLLEDSYLFYNRPLAEFRVHAAAFERGLPVPDPLGVLWERRGISFRGALVTRVFNGVELGDQIRASGADENVLREVGKTIRALHDGGMYHADLQTGNILVRGTEVRIIDLDNAKLKMKLGNLARARNLLRLRRSIKKQDLPVSCFDAILSAYGPVRLPFWLRAAYSIRGFFSDLFRRKRTSEGVQTA
jgi:3-deoxy-D-manno-octulosonic acid kinase